MYTFIHIFVDSRNSVSKLKWYHSFIKIKSNHIDIVIFSHKFLKWKSYDSRCIKSNSQF